MSRFFIPPESIKAGLAVISGEEAHHILDVMRLKKGDRIQAFDGSGKLYDGKIIGTEAKQVRVEIEAVRQALPASEATLTLVQALPKKNKMDYIVEKCTELGVEAIVPVQTARTIVKLDKDGQSGRKRRWQKIALEAAKQSGRTTIPEVKSLTPWSKVLAMLGDFDLKLLFCLSEKTEKLKDVLRYQNQAKRVAFLIGPEGDFTPEEVSAALKAGCLSVSLGENVLKSDTAAIAALTMLNYELKE